TGRSILGDLFGHLQGPGASRAVFISQDAAAHLREAAERARSSSSLEQFFSRLSNRQHDAFFASAASLGQSEQEAYTKLKDCEFVTIGHRLLVQDVERLIAERIGRADGELADPHAVRTLLEEFAWSRLGQAVRAEQVRHELERYGYVRRQLPSRDRSIERILTLTHAYLGRIEHALINGAAIPRSQSVAITEALIDRDESLLLSGGAGAGKSCVMAQIVRELDERGVVALTVPASDLRGAFSSGEVGQRLGLSDSPVAELVQAAQGERAVLCIDQLDGLAGGTERNERGQRVLREIVDQAAEHPNLRILFICRSFELEEETSFKWITEGPSAVARTLEVTVLTLDDVRRALQTAAIGPGGLTDFQKELLRVPLHLYLFVEAAQSRELGFATVDDLFDAYWREKAKRVTSHPLVSGGDWTAAASRLAHALSDREAYAAPDYELLDAFPAAAAAMASESVLFIQDGEVGFFHESFFDYAFARSFATEQRDLLDWLREDRQAYFRRRQVLGVLAFLRRRRADRGRYLLTLERLLADSEVRFHIKKRVLDWLRSIADPTAEEWEIVERQAEELGNHVWEVARNSTPWFDLLREMQRWDRWLAGSQEEADRTVVLLQTPALLTERTNAVIELLNEHRDDTPEWRLRLWNVARWSDGYGSPTKQAWLLGLIHTEPLDRSEDFARLARLLSDILFAVKEEAPLFAPQAIGAWFDRVVAEPKAAVANTERLDLRLGLDDWTTSECASAAPRAFVQEMLPRIVSIERVAPMNIVGAPRGGDHPERGPYALLATAMRQLAVEEPEALKSIVMAVSREHDVWTRWMSIAWLDAMSANPDSFSEVIVRFILDDPGRRLDLGYSWGSSGGDLFVGVSRTGVAAAAERCADESLKTLEQAILAFEPRRERPEQKHAEIQLALLWCLPENRVEESTQQRIQELEARFPEKQRRGAPQNLDDDGFGWAVSPISDDEALQISDEHWLEKMRDVARTGETFHGNQFVGGVHELSQTLEGAAVQAPARFAALTDHLNSSDPPEYFEAVLRGLTKSEDGSPRSGSLAQALRVLGRIKELGVPMPGGQIAHAFGALAEEPLPNDLMAWLNDIAMTDPDPDKDDWLGPEDSMAPVTQAINTARGSAAYAIAKLLYADVNRWNQFRDTVHQLAVDPVLAVRSTAANCLLAILNANPDEALQCFRRLINGAEPIVGSFYVEHFIRRATQRSYLDMRSTLNQLLDSGEVSAQRVGARWIVLSALSPHNSAAREDEAKVLQLGEHIRAGAADIYAANLLHEQAGSWCASRLAEMFEDQSKVVRRSAAACWDSLGPEQIAGHSVLLSTFARSRTFSESRISALLVRLGKSSQPPPVEICDIAERALAEYGPKAASIQYMEAMVAQLLAKLLFRLLETTDDWPLEVRVRNIIDQMIKANFYGVEEELRRRLDE
ncbi:MAG: ATP-binding protein, partial [Chloroflexi bacterium]|nr:ATP-binding protein [Chloroflexota bacterium]